VDLSRVTTRDVLAVLVVAAALVFNGISLITGKGPDASTMTLAGAVVGYYFNTDRKGQPIPDEDELVAPPYTGDGD
jgi:hypothetical protein